MRRGFIARNVGRTVYVVVGYILFLTYFKLEKRKLRNVSAEDPLEPDVPPGPAQSGLGPTEVTTAQETTGTVIGRYHLLQKIGEGGMGEVWLAEQKEPVRRRVALKLIKAGMDTREVVARFESERQALALMDHPAIAKVFDAGSTPQGAPYFVMEYVAGVPITTYCDNHRLSTRDRLELFMHVCEGVQHAHQKAIIHRDLKPTNILVTEVDGKAAPKIIDFGVAKALTQKLTADTMFTRVGAMIGTPEYMSPEQALSSGEDIDTRTDVYSLGIIFYELLAGAPPIELHKIAFDEFLRRLREDEPPKPSTKIRTQDPATMTEVARNRHTEPLALAKQMRGDLDSIALKALEKERSRRYGSPSDFAADIGRSLRNEAVLAVPPSAAYRARRFARRYRGPLLTVCAFAVVLIFAAAVSIRQGVLATRQRDRADREAAMSKAISDFLQRDLLEQASATSQSEAGTKPDPDLKVRTALDRAAARIAGKFDGQLELEAAIRATLGRTYTDLGAYAAARIQLERALALQRQVLGLQNPKTLKTIYSLGANASLQSDYPRAEKLLSQATEGLRRALGSEHPDTLMSMIGLADVYSKLGKNSPAENMLKDVVETQRRRLGPDNPDTLKSMNSLAIVYYSQGKYPEAESLYKRILETRRRTLGLEHPDTLNSMNNLPIAYRVQGKNEEAEALNREALEIRRRVLGPEHPKTLTSMGNLADIYSLERKYAEAEGLLNEALEAQRRVLGEEHRVTQTSEVTLGNVYFMQGKCAQSEALYKHVLEVWRRVLGPDVPETLWSANLLANAYSCESKYAQAEALLNQNLDITRRALGPEHPLTLGALTSLSDVYVRKGNYAGAERYIAEALATRRHSVGSEDPLTMENAADLALVYLSLGKLDQSEPLAREAVEFCRKKRPDDFQRFYAENVLAGVLAARKNFGDAEPLLLSSYQGMVARKNTINVPDQYVLDTARERIASFYQTWGKPDKVSEWRRK